MSTPRGQNETADGASMVESHTRKASRSPPNEEVCCIYVHAGAGYHSHQNEKIHLDACNEYVVRAVRRLDMMTNSITALPNWRC